MKFYTTLVISILLSVISMTGCGDSAGKSSGNLGIEESPMVSSTFPADFDIGVATNASIAVTFSRLMNNETINSETFTLQQDGSPVEGIVTYTGYVATFNPAADLTPNTLYTASVTTGVMDMDNNTMQVDRTWEFTTGELTDVNAPFVSSTNPFEAESQVALNRNISATFNEWMDHSSITASSFTITDGVTQVAGVVTYVGYVATFNPAENLSANTTYTAAITVEAKDLAGNSLTSDKIWIFTTGETADITPPQVSSTDPANGVANVLISRNISAVFDDGMNPTTITAATFKLAKGSTPIAGSVTYAGDAATFNPTIDLQSGTTYTATITTGVRDLANNSLAADKIWNFTTGALPPLNPSLVNLGIAGGFVILANTSISNVPTSVVTGDVGLVSGEASLTGFDPLSPDTYGDISTSPQITGRIYTLDYSENTIALLGTANDDMLTAFNDAASVSRVPDFTDIGTGGNISGQILCRGVYKWNSGVVMSTNVYLEGGPADVWIFQIEEGLTLNPDAKIILSGGALAKNVFWQCNGTVALDTNTQLEGTVLGKTNITLATGAKVNGRLLAQTAVTLQSNIVTKPAP